VTSAWLLSPGWYWLHNAENGPGTALITRAHLKSWLPSFQPPDAAEMARFDPPLGLRFPGAHAVSAVDSRSPRIVYVKRLASN
jgi:hypothetical protein